MVEAFFDTSVLLAGLIEIGGPEEAAQKVMAAVSQGRVQNPSTAWHCCLEFYSVATRLPPEYRLSPQAALYLMEEEIIGRFEVHQLPRETHLTLLRSAVNSGVVGGQVYDAHIGAIALNAGAKALVTENVKHFRDLFAHGIEVLVASDFLSYLDSPDK